MPVEESLNDALSSDKIHDGIVEGVLGRRFDTSTFDDSTTLDIEDEAYDAVKNEVLQEEILWRQDKLRFVMPQLIERHHTIKQRISAKNSEKYWKKPFQLLDEYISLCLELGERLNSELRPHAAEENWVTFEALIRIQGRACLIAQEVLTLMEHGFPDGANARWRSLFELSIVSIFIVENGNRTAERYLAHDVIQSYKAACIFQECAERLGDSKEPQTYIDELKKRRDALCANFGPTFGEPYGWAAEALGVTDKRSIHFREIEKATEMDHMQPYYRLASHPVHADAKALYFSLGHAQDGLILAGPTNLGMADPGQNTAISLFNVNLSLLQAIHSVRPSGIVVALLEQRKEEILEAFIDVHRRLEPDSVGSGS